MTEEIKWLYNNLKASLNRLNKLYKQSTSNQEREFIKSQILELSNDIKNLEVSEQRKSPLENYQKNKELLEKISFCYHDILSYDTSYQYEHIKEPRIALNSEELLDITKSFFKECTNDLFYESFMKNYEQRKTHFRIDFAYSISQTNAIPSLNESFIIIARWNTYEDIATTIHEYAHATSSIINPHHIYIPPKRPFCELDSIFMELITIDYLTKIFPENEIRNYQRQAFNDYNTVFKLAKDMIKLIEYESSYPGGYQSIEDIKSAIYTNKIEENRTTILTYPYYEYLLGCMFSLELYSIYQEDRDYALSLLEQFINLKYKDSKSYYDTLLSWNIKPNTNYPKIMKKSLSK